MEKGGGRKKENNKEGREEGGKKEEAIKDRKKEKVLSLKLKVVEWYVINNLRLFFDKNFDPINILSKFFLSKFHTATHFDLSIFNTIDSFNDISRWNAPAKRVVAKSK